MILGKTSKTFLFSLILGLFAAGLYTQTAKAADAQIDTIATVNITLTIGDTGYSKNDETLTLDVPPYISQDNRTMVPIRFIAEGLGATVTWVDTEKTDYIKLNDNTVACKVGEVLPDNMGTAIIKDDRLFVPIRYIVTNLGADVNWDAQARKVIVTMSVSAADWVDFDSVMRLVSINSGSDYANQILKFDKENQKVHLSYDSHNTGDLPTLVINNKVYVGVTDINNLYALLDIPTIYPPSEHIPVDATVREYVDNPNAFITVEKIWNETVKEPHSGSDLIAGMAGGNGTTDIGDEYLMPWANRGKYLNALSKLLISDWGVGVQSDTTENRAALAKLFRVIINGEPITGTLTRKPGSTAAWGWEYYIYHFDKAYQIGDIKSIRVELRV